MVPNERIEELQANDYEDQSFIPTPEAEMIKNCIISFLLPSLFAVHKNYSYA